MTPVQRAEASWDCFLYVHWFYCRRFVTFKRFFLQQYYLYEGLKPPSTSLNFSATNPKTTRQTFQLACLHFRKQYFIRKKRVGHTETNLDDQEEASNDWHSIQMLYITIILGIIGRITCGQTLAYTTNDTVYIPYAENIILSSFMSTRANESISGSEVKMLIQFMQQTSSSETLLNYNIIYFNLQSKDGLQCYSDYFNGNLTANEMLVTHCQNESINEMSTNSSCYNLTECQNESFSFIMQLSEDQYSQNVLIIENIHPANQKDIALVLDTKITMSFEASISWFYGAVALTCLLLINLVFLTGVALYWILKYRKVKRIYEQFRLTETDYETKQIRSILKQQ